MKSQDQINVERARKLPKKLRASAEQAWFELQQELSDQVPAAPKSKQIAVYVVHRALGISRAAFIAKLVETRDVAACVESARVAFPFKKDSE